MKEKVTRKECPKAIKGDCTSDDEESNHNDEEAFPLIVRALTK